MHEVGGSFYSGLDSIRTFGSKDVLLLMKECLAMTGGLCFPLIRNKFPIILRMGGAVSLDNFIFRAIFNFLLAIAMKIFSSLFLRRDLPRLLLFYGIEFTGSETAKGLLEWNVNGSLRSKAFKWNRILPITEKLKLMSREFHWTKVTISTRMRNAAERIFLRL